MLEMLTHPAAFPFACALAVMVALASLEVLSLLFGAQLSGLLDNLMPDLDLDTDLDADSGHAGPGALLVWLKLDELPLLMVLIVFLTLFGLIGLGIQTVVADATGAPWPLGIAVLATLVALVLPLRWLLVGLARVMPGDETEAVARADLVGLSGSIVLGTARRGSPAQAKVRNTLGQTHYVMVEPEQDGEAFAAGETIVLTVCRANLFLARGVPRIEQPGLSKGEEL